MWSATDDLLGAAVVGDGNELPPDEDNLNGPEFDAPNDGTGEDASTDGMDDGDSDGDASLEDELDASFPGSFSICERLSTDKNTSTWSIVGPVPRTRGRVDAVNFTHVMRLRGPAALTCRELYVRAAHRLVQCGMYRSLAAT